ncbi:hypothetical protein, partial [Streptomyces sp. NRRL S-495]|uniref:hypothetical protein n=1 Tax=Streptomyces sp. NRRL S-495 TaxID=1609133 RepID=UPI0025706A49
MDLALNAAVFTHSAGDLGSGWEGLNGSGQLGNGTTGASSTPDHAHRADRRRQARRAARRR